MGQDRRDYGDCCIRRLRLYRDSRTHFRQLVVPRRPERLFIDLVSAHCFGFSSWSDPKVDVVSANGRSWKDHLFVVSLSLASFCCSQSRPNGI